MTLRRYNFGTYQCGGKTLPEEYWIDPERIVAVLASVAGRSSSRIYIHGAESIRIELPPERVVEIIESAGTK